MGRAKIHPYPFGDPGTYQRVSPRGFASNLGPFSHDVLVLTLGSFHNNESHNSLRALLAFVNKTKLYEEQCYLVKS